MVFWLVVVLVAVTVFALSNTDTVTVRFWQWPLYTGPLALALIGSGVLGALAVFVASVARHARLGGQLRHLETRLRALEAGPSQGHAAPPPGSRRARGRGHAPGSRERQFGILEGEAGPCSRRVRGSREHTEEELAGWGAGAHPTTVRWFP